MVMALMDGRALTAGELAGVGGVTPATASGHLLKLSEGGLLIGTQQGRHRYFCLSGGDVAELVETIMCVSERVRPVRTGPRDVALRQARVCYDHLAGARAVALYDGWTAAGWIKHGSAAGLTPRGRAALTAIGIPTASLEQMRRSLCRPCLDWSERRPHLGGTLGAALLQILIEKNWVERGRERVVHFTQAGEAAWVQMAAGSRSTATV